MQIIKAMEFAKKAHEGQKRKYTGEPYFYHCLEVARLVTDVGGSTNAIVAALLHDTVEDCGVTFSEICKEFGPQVCALVCMVTDVSKPEDGNRQTRKEMDRKHVACASPEGKIIKLCDLLSNSRSILEAAKTNKEAKEFAKVYIPEKLALLEVLKEGDLYTWNRCKEICDNYMKENNNEMPK